MPDTVIAIVKAGLGNQLFIYAAARALALRTGRDLYLDTARGYTRDKYGRSYRLDRFPIRSQVMPETWRIAPDLKHLRHRFIRTYNKCLPRNLRSYLGERSKLTSRQLTDWTPMRKRVTLVWYWQDEAYFSDQASILREELTILIPEDSSNRECGQRFAELDTVFLHFRSVRYHHVLGLDYYQQVIDMICKQVVASVFVLFGDDMNTPRSGLDFHGCAVERVDDNAHDESADLWLMSCCRHAIIANSSFSWWGAWLGAGARGGMVFAPERTRLALRPAADWHLVPCEFEEVKL